MEEKTSFSSHVKFGKRKLLVQTEYDPAHQIVGVTVADSGQVIDSREYLVDSSAEQDPKDPQVRQCHDLVLADLELLYSTIKNVQATPDADAHARLGTLLLDKGLIEEAVDIFAALLSLDAEYENGHYLLGKALFKKGDYDGALSHLEIAVEKTPDYPDVLLWISRVHRQRGDFSRAIQRARTSLEINPDYHEALYDLGLYLIESVQSDPKNTELPPPIERVKEARACLLQAAKSSDAYDREGLDAALDLLENRDQWEAAIAEIKKASRVKAVDTRSLVLDGEFYLRFMFADLHKEHRSLDNYIRILEKSINQHPNYPDVRLSLGTAFLIRCWHYYGKALEEYREAVKINPNFQKAKKNLKLLENDGRGFLLLLRAILK